MLIKSFYDEHLAQVSYMVGCSATGEALIIDPMRDITPYLHMAEREGLRITHIAETHIHADFVSGGQELASATNAALYLSDMGDANWKYAFAHEPSVILVREGDSWMVGNVRVRVWHTPGHTPEHISFIITDTAAANEPIGIFTGDFVFVGDVGRPDLLEAVAGVAGSKELGARHLFASLQALKTMPDYLQIWPGHGAGSACGKALGAIPSTTVGYEKRFNPAFGYEDEADFVQWLLDGQPEAPHYFAHMKRINKQGPALLRDLPVPRQMNRAELDEALAHGAFVADLRSPADFAAGHIPGTISIPAINRTFTTYFGWLADYTAPCYLIIPSAQQAPVVLAALRAIGIDAIAGYGLPNVVTAQDAPLPSMSAQDLAERLPSNGLVVLDVRGHSEYCEGHIEGARHLMLGLLPQRLHDVPRDKTVVTQCASGYRSQIAASWLRARGYNNVINLRDGRAEWARALPTTGCTAR